MSEDKSLADKMTDVGESMQGAGRSMSNAGKEVTSFVITLFFLLGIGCCTASFWR